MDSPLRHQPLKVVVVEGVMMEENIDNVEELLDSLNQELTMDELIEMHEQGIEDLESLDTVQKEDRMMITLKEPKFSSNKNQFQSSYHSRDEAHFWLNGYVNKQNCRIWSEANPQVYVETPLHPEKLIVWCALWAGGILLQKR
ncbi:hypothetical protein TNCV_1206741 [Trichonephila clavipes]|nr:hypothetical protein TNCV_1206741 [Trichonephila clavipes]